MTAPSDLTSAAGGSAGLEGYLYQRDVSVWMALDLILARQLASQIILEPRGHEDLQTEVAETAPSAMTEVAETADYTLVTQCKLRGIGPWSLNGLAKLLGHGGPNRPSARQRLQDARTRYLLVTSADLEGRARQVLTGAVGDWPSAMPTTLKSPAGPDITGRVAVMAGLDFEKLSGRTRSLLVDRFRVPGPNLEACRDALWNAALLRMRGGGGGVWTRAEIGRVIVDHDGYLGASPTSAAFVPPNNWASIRTALDTRHAVIIRGGSGSGKTTAAEALMETTRQLLPDARVVRVEGGPEKVRAVGPEHPVIFMVEDPWGKFRLSPGAEPWNDAIVGLLGGARADRKFIVTSRSDVLRESGPKRLAESWFVDLEGDNYGAKERKALFDNRLSALPRPLHAAVDRHRELALDQLATPLEMQRFFDGLAQGPGETEHDAAFVRRCLSDAQSEGLETAILRSIRFRNDWPWAAVAWGLFKARSQQSFSVTPIVQAGLSKRDPTLRDGLEPYLNFLVAGRNLRQVEAVLSYQHPRVEQGLESAIRERPETSSQVLSLLVDTLIGMDHGEDDWGVESAAALAYAVRQQPVPALEISTESAARLDAWLAARLAATADSFQDDLARSAVLGSTTSPLAELARWLTHLRTKRPVFPPASWALRPDVDEAWYAWVRNDPATATICAAFVQRILPFEHGRHPTAFVHHIVRLAPDIVKAFAAAAMDIVGHGYLSGAGPIIAGALEDLDGFAPVAQAAVDLRANQTADDGFWLACANHEIDPELADDIAQSRGEDGHTAGEILTAYVNALRDRGGWTALHRHPAAADLATNWCATLPNVPDPAELLALWAVVQGSEVEAAFWNRVTGAWDDALAASLLGRLAADGLQIDLRMALVHAALTHLVADQVGRMLDNKASAWRILEIAVDIRGLVTARDLGPVLAAQARAMLGAISGAPGAAALVLADPAPAPHADPAVAEHLAAAPYRTDVRVNLRLAQVLGPAGRDVAPRLEAVLAADGWPDESTIASVVAALEMAAGLENWTLVARALDHRFADVRERALEVLAGRTPGRLAPRLLVLAADPGSRVKRALIKLIEARPHAAHQEVLLALADDPYSGGPGHYGEDPDYPIAQAAAKLLVRPPILVPHHIETLQGIISKTDDSHLRRLLLEAMLCNGPPEAALKVLKLALATGRGALHASAAAALYQKAEFVSAEMADQIEARQLTLRNPDIAISLALVVGARASAEHVRAVAAALVVAPGRRALLFPLWLSAHDREFAGELLALLDDAPLRSAVAAVSAADLIARDTFDHLGGTQVTEALLRRLSGMFEPPAKSAPPPFVMPSEEGGEDDED